MKITYGRKFATSLATPARNIHIIQEPEENQMKAYYLRYQFTEQSGRN